MSDSPPQFDTEKALAFLSGFYAPSRRQGERYFKEKRVETIWRELPADIYCALVNGIEPYRVELEYGTNSRWQGRCACPLRSKCKHVYAALKAVLAQVKRGAPFRVVQVKAKADSAHRESDFSDEVISALGRPLAPKENEFLKKLTQTYNDSLRRGHLTGWDLEELNLRLGLYSWDAVTLWPSPPKNLKQFWLYLAAAARNKNVSWPAFLDPVTDLAEIEPSLEEWRRRLEIERWTHKLSTLPIAELNGPELSLEQYDLRLRIEEGMVQLEWLPPGCARFETLKLNDARSFAEELRQGNAQLTPEAEWLWAVLEPKIPFFTKNDFRLESADMRRMLARLFRSGLLDQRIVNSHGEPFERVTAKLRWEVAAPENDAGDYRVRLVQGDGSPLPPVLCVLPASPALYLTPKQLFQGAMVKRGELDPMVENLIPAQAMESRGGVALLSALRVELPPRLRERVTLLPLRPVISCKLHPLYQGSKVEALSVRVEARTPSGQGWEYWNGTTWLRFNLEPNPGKANEPIPVYDRSQLPNMAGLLEPLGLKWEGYYQQFSLRVSKKFPEQFSSWLQTVPAHLEIELAGELSSFKEEPLAGTVRLEVTEREIDWFDLRVVLDVADTTLTPEELKLLLDAKGRFVRLENRGWSRLAFNLSQEEDENLARLGLNPHELSSEPQRLHALQLAQDAARKFLPEQHYEQLKIRAGEIQARVTPAIPETVQAELRPYQTEGFHFLAYLAANRFGGILADDMGLGKTLQTLTWLEWLRAAHGATAIKNDTPRGKLKKGKSSSPDAPAGAQPLLPASLVVCPKSVMDNWRAEAERFTPGLRVKVWNASELGNILDANAEADLHVINYSQLRLLGESLAPLPWLAVILDEGQYIKNPNSQTAQAARSLQAQYRLVLSGTPIENRLLDLWSLMCFAMPGALGSRSQFAKLFDAKEDPLARRRLSARVRPFLLRRTKSQVAKDLPDRTEEDLFCEIEGEQLTLYRAEFKRAQQILLGIKTQKELAKQQFHFLTSLLRLRQICCHPKLVKADSTSGSAKLEALFEQIEPLMEEGHKVLVFSQFVEMLDILRQEFENRKWAYFYLSGQTENRGELVRQFQGFEGPATFLISLKAGGFGLNLTAASYVILFDPWWNPAVENQAIDRTHRIGQTRNVMAYRLLIKGSIEEKIRLLQKKKTALAEDVLGEEKFARSLTLEDLQFLFAD
jgi:hypothetical protein